VRFILLILDGLGVGALPDAGRFGDEGSDTLGNLARARGGLILPHLEALGLGKIGDIPGISGGVRAHGAYGKMAEASAGKDTLIGHWELMGLITESPFPLFPEGFPAQVLIPLREQTGRPILANIAASGTEIIELYGEDHLRTGGLIVYTSADSVFQIAAHEEVIPPAQLYRICQLARSLLVGKFGVARVIARPFAGRPGSFYRTRGRRDFSLPPPRPTLLDLLSGAGLPVTGIGKVEDIFGGRGLSQSIPAQSDHEACVRLLEQLRIEKPGLVMATLSELDTRFGHRNDPVGFARSLQELDSFLPHLLSALKEDDILVLTADHGCDPTTPSTDHSREYVPLLIAGDRVKADIALGVRSTFADVGQTVAAAFGLGPLEAGQSFWDTIAAGS
jgi:phosphopentomutase